MENHSVAWLVVAIIVLVFAILFYLYMVKLYRFRAKLKQGRNKPSLSFDDFNDGVRKQYPSSFLSKMQKMANEKGMDPEILGKIIGVNLAPTKIVPDTLPEDKGRGPIEERVDFVPGGARRLGLA